MEARDIQKSSDAVRVLQITDPHLFADADAGLRGTVTHLTLAAVIEDVLRRAWPADIVAVTGDLIQDDSKEAYERFCRLMTALDLPIYCIPGNHDVRPVMQATLSADPFHYCESVRLSDWLIVGIDSCVDYEAGGEISAAELSRLKRETEETDASHVLVCLHHPPVSMGSRWLDRVGLRNADEFLDLAVNLGKVRGTLFGHVHQQYQGEHEGIDIIGTPSTCRQFKPGSDDFALDNESPAYRRIMLNADGTIDTELIHVSTSE